MATFVPDSAYDVFVSYAHVNDEPDPGQDEGWVSTFVSVIKKRLFEKLGRPDACSLWMDPELSKHSPFTPEIRTALEKSATMLVILSPGYLASKSCLWEKNEFNNIIKGRRRPNSRIFLVEIDRVDPLQR
jgi:hypothetical protein